MRCSRIFKKFFPAVVPFLLVVLLTQVTLAVDVTTPKGGELPFSEEYKLNGGFKVTATGEHFTELEFVLPDVAVVPIEVDGMKYIRLMHPESGFLMYEGLPELISFSTGLSIPSGGTAEIGEILIRETERVAGIKIFPSQGFDLEISEEKGFIIDNDFYGKDVNYPEETGLISSPAIMRDVRLVSLTLNPFSYNPVREELTIHSRINVRVNYDERVRGENEIENPRRRISRSFEKLYRNSAINYNQFRNPNAEYQKRSILIIHHHTNDVQYQTLINQFAGWKRDKGFETATVNTSSLGNAQAIKNYIQNAYNTWENPPEYIVIIGGKTGAVPVPVWTIYDSDAYIPGNSDGDHPFTTLAGDDILPEAIIGRISIGSVEQLATAWAKIRNYERTPYFEEGNNWYNHNLLVGDPGVSGISTIITSKYIKEVMLLHNSNKTFAEVYTAPFPAQMQNGVNQGVSFFSFRGLENLAGWVSPSDGDLYNGLKLPHTTIITCRTVDFSGGKQVCRLFRMGTPAVPKGVITAIGMSWVTETAFNNCLTGGIYHGIFVGGQRTMGEALVNGKLNQWITYNNSHAWQLPRYFHQENLIGDPTLDIWVGTPEEINVTYPATIPPGSNSVRIEVTDSNDEPLADAWVTIRTDDDLVFVSGYTDATGSVTYFFNQLATGEVKVTVTKPEYIPHLGTFNITGQAAVSYDSITLRDNAVAGRRVNFAVTARNHRNQGVNGINGVITSDSEFVEIVTANSPFGNINAGGTGSNTTDFVMDLDPATPDGHRANFTLTLTDNAQNSWVSRFVVIVNNGDLVAVNMVIQDQGNGILDPDERATIMIYLRNNSQVNLQGIRGVLSGGGYGLSFINDEANFGNIIAGQTVTSSQEHFVVETSEHVIPGMIFNLTLTLSNEAGFYQVITGQLTIGSPRVTDPLGPDPYGYWCYDTGDAGYEDTPVYQWVEIVPQLGGNGVNTNLTTDFNNNQSTHIMDLPFTFRFYGIDYDVISICANGWVSFGATEQATQRNWRLPGPLGPDPIIAAFWDNLSLGAGGVYTWYDDVNSRFIVQWHNTRNVIGNAEETFQLILLDPAFYHTATADGPFKIQYRTFNNINNGANTPTGIGNWGNYATVGIADHTSTRGLEYTFNNRYPTAARPLANGSALYFTTGSVTNAPYVLIDSFSYSDDNNNLPEYGETGTLNLTLRNIGGQNAEGVTAVLSSDDPYVDIIENNAEFGNIASQETSNVADAYTINIASATPNGHRIFFNLNIIEANNIDWNFRFHLVVKAPYMVIDEFTVASPPKFGDTVNINMSLLNEGESGSRNVTAVLSSEDEYVTILNNTSNFGNIAIDESSGNNTPYRVLIANNVPDKHKAVFTLNIGSEGGQSWRDTFEVEMQAPVLVTSTPTIYDPMPGGNNNGMIDPGETVTIFLPMKNMGGAASPPVNISVETTSEHVIINEVTPANFNLLHSGHTMYPAVSISLAQTAAAGTPLPFSYAFEAGEYLFSGGFLLGVGGIIPAQMGSGNAQTTAQTASPINVYYKSLRGQMVYTAQELLDMGITTGGQITQLGFFVTSSPEYPLVHFSVRMRHTNATDVSSHIAGPYTTVYQNPSYSPAAGGWAMMQFTNPFEWNGVDNILVDTAFAPVAGWSSSGQLRIYNVPNGFRYTRADNVDQTTVETTTISADKPQALILFGIDTGALAGRPQNLEAQNEANENSLTWLAPIGRNGGRESRNTLDRDKQEDRNPLGYNIYRNGIKINANLVTTLQYSDTSFNPRISNYYYVTAVYQSSESPPSNIVLISLDVVAHPRITPAAAIQYEAFLVTITTTTEDAVIYYTLNGSEPTENSNLYTEPFELDKHAAVKTRGFKENWVSSEVASIDYKILYAPQNLRSSGSQTTANIYWDEPRSPDNLQALEATGKRTRSFAREENRKFSPNNESGSRNTELIGYNVYRAEDEENFILLNDVPIEELEYEDPGLAEGTYRYYIKAVYGLGFSQPTRTTIVNIGTTNIEEDDPLPTVTALLNAYPNPFNPETVIPFSLAAEQKVTIEIYNIIGRKIKTVIEERLPAGNHHVSWKGDDDSGKPVSSGIYLYRMTGEDYQAVNKVILLK